MQLQCSYDDRTAFDDLRGAEPVPAADGGRGRYDTWFGHDAVSTPRLPPDSEGPDEGTTAWHRNPVYPSYMSFWDGQRYTSHMFWDGNNWVECPSPGWWLASDNSGTHPSFVLRSRPCPPRSRLATTPAAPFRPSRPKGSSSVRVDPTRSPPLRRRDGRGGSRTLAAGGGTDCPRHEPGRGARWREQRFSASVLTAVNTSLANKTADVT